MISTDMMGIIQGFMLNCVYDCDFCFQIIVHGHVNMPAHPREEEEDNDDDAQDIDATQVI